jgi:hypothetical protein
MMWLLLACGPKQPTLPPVVQRPPSEPAPVVVEPAPTGQGIALTLDWTPGSSWQVEEALHRKALDESGVESHVQVRYVATAEALEGDLVLRISQGQVLSAEGVGAQENAVLLRNPPQLRLDAAGAVVDLVEVEQTQAAMVTDLRARADAMAEDARILYVNALEPLLTRDHLQRIADARWSHGVGLLVGAHVQLDVPIQRTYAAPALAPGGEPLPFTSTITALGWRNCGAIQCLAVSLVAQPDGDQAREQLQAALRQAMAQQTIETGVVPVVHDATLVTTRNVVLIPSTMELISEATVSESTVVLQMGEELAQRSTLDVRTREWTRLQ